MSNKRIFWAVQALGFSAMGDRGNIVEGRGVQSVGITTNFNLEQVFQLGELQIYENIEDLPDVELTTEKVLDGNPLLYHLATRGYAANTLNGRSDRRADVYLSIYGDVQDSASGTPVSQVFMSGMYPSSLSYTFPVDGNFTESITLVGNNKVWKTSGFDFTPNFTNDSVPPSGVQRRQNLIFEVPASDFVLDDNGQVITSEATILPKEIPGISSSGTNNRDADLQFGAHVQNISISVDLGRESLNELGRRGPYFRFISFPTEVSCDIEIYGLTGDGIDAVEAAETNITNQSIRIYCFDGTFINLGTKNKLSSVNYSGGDAGGGNVTVSYSYSNFNQLVVTHPADPVT